MLATLLKQYSNKSPIYLSWDAASWHMSKMLYARVAEHNDAIANGGVAGPLVALAPLPAGARFLNVIESVFSGMARAVMRDIAELAELMLQDPCRLLDSAASGQRGIRFLFASTMLRSPAGFGAGYSDRRFCISLSISRSIRQTSLYGARPSRQATQRWRQGSGVQPARTDRTMTAALRKQSATRAAFSVSLSSRLVIPFRLGYWRRLRVTFSHEFSAGRIHKPIIAVPCLCLIEEFE
jgi:hypothetical protein